MPRGYRYAYKVRIEKETRPALSELAGDLGYIADVPGAKFGEPSPAAMLDALAAAYRANPGMVTATLRALLDK